MSTQRLAYTTDLSDEEWQLLAPLLPPEKSGGRPRKYPLREVINGIQYILRGGCAWRLMPHDLPHWQTAYQIFRAWRRWHLAQDSRSAPRRRPHVHGPPPPTLSRDY
jgi:putative transposase